MDMRLYFAENGLLVGKILQKLSEFAGDGGFGMAQGG
jgi:hypothetical protein